MSNISKTIKVDSELVRKVEEADYNYSSKRDVVSTYINNGMDTSNSNFIKYQQEMNKAYGEFNKLKGEIEKTYIFPEYSNVTVSWNLDYSTEELTVNVIA